MEFLKGILGEELYNQLVSKINEHNGNEANKDKKVKLANLESGEYVGKLKYDDIVAQLTGKQTELDTANNLISELKKGTEGNEELQGKITGYESQVADLQAQLQETKIKSALKVGLLAEKCDDVDYVSYVLEKKLKEQGKTLELDENENIKGWNDLLSGVKTQLPAHFEKANSIEIEPNRLPGQNTKPGTLTKEEFNKMGYSSRVKLKEENPELYANMTKG